MEPVWVIETKPDQFTTATAANVIFHESGALLFRNSERDLVLAKAPGTWLSVHAQEEETPDV